jgi:hypothetical protein
VAARCSAARSPALSSRSWRGPPAAQRRAMAASLAVCTSYRARSPSVVEVRKRPARELCVSAWRQAEARASLGGGRGGGRGTEGQTMLTPARDDKGAGVGVRLTPALLRGGAGVVVVPESEACRGVGAPDAKVRRAEGHEEAPLRVGHDVADPGAPRRAATHDPKRSRGARLPRAAPSRGAPGCGPGRGLAPIHDRVAPADDAARGVAGVCARPLPRSARPRARRGAMAGIRPQSPSCSIRPPSPSCSIRPPSPSCSICRGSGARGNASARAEARGL